MRADELEFVFPDAGVALDPYLHVAGTLADAAPVPVLVRELLRIAAVTDVLLVTVHVTVFAVAACRSRPLRSVCPLEHLAVDDPYVAGEVG